MRIVWATDGSDAATQSVALLRAFDGPDTRIVVTVVGPPALLSDARPDPSMLLWHTVPAYRDDVSEAMTELVVRETERLSTFRGDVSSAARLGSPSAEIIQVAIDESADLVVLGAHGHGMARRLLLGSVSQQVALHAPCSVLVTRGGRRPSRVVLGVDGSPESERALALLEAMEHRAGDRVVVVHAVRPLPALRPPRGSTEEEFRSLLREVEQSRMLEARTLAGDVERRLIDAGWETETVVRSAEPPELLVDVATERDVDLVALGARGVTSPLAEFSEDARHVLLHAPCSVLVARAEAGAG